MSNTIAIPNQPLTILTPAPRPGLELKQETLQLIKDNADRLIDQEQNFSVTFSPVLCPNGKNFLFDLHPHYWKVANGHWERRDGLRNPYCDIPQGKKQTGELAKAITFLGLCAAYIPEKAEMAKNKVDELLRVFFLDDETRCRPEIFYSQCIPGEDPLVGNSLFIISCRFLMVISQYLPLVALTNGTERQVKDWIRQHVQWMKHSEQGKECAERDDNKVVWYQAVMASHFALVDPPQALEIAAGFFEKAIRDKPDPADFFSKLAHRARPRHYALFLLEPTFILASLTSSNGVPPPPILKYLGNLVEFVSSVEQGQIEKEVDADERFFAKLAFFGKIMDSWHGASGDPWEMDGRGWPGGWSDWMKVSWDVIQ